MAKIKMSQKDFDKSYEVIEPDTPQPDLDKLTKELKPEVKEESVLTEAEQKIDDDYHEQFIENEVEQS